MRRETERQRSNLQTRRNSRDKRYQVGLRPFLLISIVNLMNLQKELKVILKVPLNSGTPKREQEVSREMADYSVIMHYLDSKQLNYYTFSPNRRNL
jgi:hypothetical protein